MQKKGTNPVVQTMCRSYSIRFRHKIIHPICRYIVPDDPSPFLHDAKSMDNEQLIGFERYMYVLATDTVTDVGCTIFFFYKQCISCGLIKSVSVPVSFMRSRNVICIVKRKQTSQFQQGSGNVENINVGVYILDRCF